MIINVEISIDDATLSSAANSAANALFKPVDRYLTPPVGYKLLIEAVEKAARNIDLSAMAKEAAEKYAKGIIEEVTRETIKKIAKSVVKEEKEAGTLLPFGKQS